MRSWIARVVAGLLALAVTAGSALMILRLHAPSPLDRTSGEIVQDALPRLRYLREALDGGAATQMQALFPEGHFFTWVLYGLTWVEVGKRDPDLRQEALNESRRALVELDSPTGRAPFDQSLDPPYGVFYVGWSTWLRGGIVSIAGAGARSEQSRLAADTQALMSAFTTSLDTTGSPFLTSYPGQAWPVDSVVGIAAAALGGDRTGIGTAPLIERWTKAVDERRDTATGLIPHRVDPVSGMPVEGARGTSQAMILRFLHEFDPERGFADWKLFWKAFRSGTPGAPGVLEYPRGTDGEGDVDSGPLVLGMSASASVVTIADAVLCGNRTAARDLTGLAETTGGAVTFGGRRRYLAGQVPVGDAFLAWALTTSGWLQPAHRPDNERTSWWRLPWYVAIGYVLGVGWVLFLATWKLRRP